MPKLVLPRVQAMVICDGLKEIEDEAAVFDLHRVRSYLIVPALPAFVPRLSVFLHMSGHAGEAVCRVQIERLETGEFILESRSKSIAFKHPGTVEAVWFRLRNCVFPAPGVYYVQLLEDQKVIGERPFEIRYEE